MYSLDYKLMEALFSSLLSFFFSLIHLQSLNQCRHMVAASAGVCTSTHACARSHTQSWNEPAKRVVSSTISFFASFSRTRGSPGL